MDTAGATHEETLYARAIRLGPTLPGTLSEIAEFFALHPDQVAASSAKDIATAISTSDASVIRAGRALGYSSMKAVRQAALEMITSRVDPGAALQRRMQSTTGGSHLRAVVQDTATAVSQFQESLSEIDWDAIISTVASATRVACYGLAPIGFVAEYLAFALARTGVDAWSSRMSGLLLADDLAKLQPGDVLIVFAPIRQFNEVTAACRHARDIGVPVVLITEAIGMPVRSEVDFAITTAPTSLTSASDASVPLVVAQALVNAVASTAPEGAIEHMNSLNRLRSQVSSQPSELTAKRVDISSSRATGEDQ